MAAPETPKDRKDASTADNTDAPPLDPALEDLPEGAIIDDIHEHDAPEAPRSIAADDEPMPESAVVEEISTEPLAAALESADSDDEKKPRFALSQDREAARHGSVSADLENPEEIEEAPAAAAPERARLTRKQKKDLAKKGEGAGLVHSSQLDERLRHGDAEATPRDRALKIVFDSVTVTGLLILVAVIGGAAGFIGFLSKVSAQVYTLAFVATLLAGNSILFNFIRWRALRGHQGIHVLEKWKADLQLTVASIIALFTVIFIAFIEVSALLAFLGVINVGTAGSALARNFVLFQVIILLVYVLTLVVRENNVTSYQPHRNLVIASWVLTGVAAFAALFGVLLTAGAPQSLGILSTITRGQGIYIVTLGVGLEFIAVRIRLRLPSVISLFRAAVDVSMRANEEMRVQLQKRAQRTYLASFAFVALSMAFAGAIATGNLGVGSGSATLALVIFYVGTAIILLGLITVRIFQGRNLERRTVKDEGDLESLVGQKRKAPAEIFRLGVFGVTGLIAAMFVLLAVMIGTDRLPIFEKKYATDFFIVAILFGAGPYGFYFNAERKRMSAIDEKFPDFLRDIAESARAGMTLPRALVTAASGNYGALTKDIQHMAAQVEWGVEFAEALERFAERANTPLIDRTVSLVVEAQRAGGNVVDILTAASDDAREIKQIVSERDEQMQMYSVVVYIAYFVFIAVVLILSAQFIPAFKEAVGAASGQQVGGLNFKDFDPEEFNTLFFHAALVQAIGGGLVGGVLTKGHPVAGFSNIVIMVIAAWFSFRVLIGVM